jgi:hypothetical protein
MAFGRYWIVSKIDSKNEIYRNVYGCQHGCSVKSFLDFCQEQYRSLIFIIAYTSSLNHYTMFIGHFALSFAVKKAAPKVSLGTLFIATQFVDILWPFLLLLNMEQVAIVPGYTKSNALEFLYFPYTHSLLAGVLWGSYPQRPFP